MALSSYTYYSLPHSFCGNFIIYFARATKSQIKSLAKNLAKRASTISNDNIIIFSNTNIPATAFTFSLALVFIFVLTKNLF